MNIFDIIGPVMIGPSSSHTAGVVRIGNIISEMLDRPMQNVVVKFHGSFAATYEGHGSDKAIIGGLLGFKPDDPRIRDSLRIAEQRGVQCSFKTVTLKDAHPNTVVVAVTDDGGRGLSVTGESVGGGNIIIRRINGTEVELSGKYDTIITNHTDQPGVASLVTNILAIKQINIANMKVFRATKGGSAIMVIETDARLDRELAGVLTGLPGIERAAVIPGAVG